MEVQIDILKGLSEVFKSAGEAIKSLGDGIAHLAALGTKGFDQVVARRARSRLREIDVKLVQFSSLVTCQLAEVLMSLLHSVTRSKQTTQSNLNFA